MKPAVLACVVFLIACFGCLSIKAEEVYSSVGDDVILTCRHPRRRDARRLLWQYEGGELPPKLDVNVNGTDLNLRIENITYSDTGRYTCRKVGGRRRKHNAVYANVNLHVGVRPVISDFKCYSENILEMWCEWDLVDSTNDTVEVFTYRHYFESTSAWRDCPDVETRGRRSCFFDRWTNYGSLHVMRIVVSNAYGHDEKEIKFNPDTQTRTRPPASLTLVRKTPYTVHVRVGKPDNWIEDYLQVGYALQYRDDVSEDQTWKNINDAYNKDTFVAVALKPYTAYSFRAKCRTEYGVNGSWSDYGDTLHVLTDQAAPFDGVKLRISLAFLEGDSVEMTVVVRQDPVFSNGVIEGYHFDLRKGTNETGKELILESGLRGHTFTNLTSMADYTVIVTAYNGAGASPPTYYMLNTRKCFVSCTPPAY
ncbi:interleukin-6 receptor subunit beta-like [Glandiceps talaboti]